MIHNVDSIFMNTSISGKAEFILILCPGQFGDARWWQNHPVQRKVPPPSRSSSSSRSSPRSPRPQFSLVSRQQLGPEGVQPSHFAAPSAEPPQQQLPPSPWTSRGPSCLLVNGWMWVWRKFEAALIGGEGRKVEQIASARNVSYTGSCTYEACSPLINFRLLTKTRQGPRLSFWDGNAV